MQMIYLLAIICNYMKRFDTCCQIWPKKYGSRAEIWSPFFSPILSPRASPRWGAPIARQCPALSCHRADRRRDDFLRLSLGSVAGYHYVPGRSIIICNVMVLQEGLLKSQKLLHQNRRRRRKAKTHVRKHEPLCLRIVWRLCTMTKNSRHTSQHQ